MPNMDLINQEFNEKRYSRKHIDGYIREALLASPDMCARMKYGVQLLEEYRSKDYYESKNARVAQLVNMDLKKVVLDVFTGVAYTLRPELFTSVTAQMAGRLGFDDKVAAITTMAEIMAVLCHTDAYDIYKLHKMDSLRVISNIALDANLIDYIEHSQYLPPMVCAPKTVATNYTSGYLTHNDSVMLGKGNHHDGDLCLDALNIMNQVELKLDLDFLCKVEEEPTFEFETQEQCDQWFIHKRQSYRFYDMIQSQGNRFYLTHKVDKRGRIYAQGYHINTQGTAFKKASIELANEELVEGVP